MSGPDKRVFVSSRLRSVFLHAVVACTYQDRFDFYDHGDSVNRTNAVVIVL